MEWDVFKAIVNDGGGFENIALLIFDNNILIINTDKKSCEESDFVQIGGKWMYKEKVYVRNKKTFTYDIELINYHPLDYLQAVVMGDIKNVDRQSISDMF
jgi:hypothetical protein